MDTRKSKYLVHKISRSNGQGTIEGCKLSLWCSGGGGGGGGGVNFMQIVCLVDSSHEMSYPCFLGKIFHMLSAEFFTRHAELHLNPFAKVVSSAHCISD